MDVQINEITTTIKTVDGTTLISPDVMRQIISAVMRAVEDRDTHAERVRAERRVTGGVSQERDTEE
jgi:hypothetical protein